ncbi:TetR family transcriptional regulator [Achromobacter sp. HZ01]|jgi:AcrR family transcriptional regulator|uniref:TetR family transcriptional regulator n=1 Tax=Achromobacter pulmonis TaxID=1389932 RepID=A0A2N8KKV2_9BURK|nr:MULTISPECIES: TetR/AcrR family transcriptional regulator [Achromobacter]PND34075.1 TetR family transcriptional regulator [Achromobacter pulmonis]RAP64823.1 TetR family transcriptional regulator [Achromobacter sp. HZ01]
MASKTADTRPAAKQPLAADRIRKTAREMFYRDGIRAVGVDAIVNEAGVTKPSLYRSFSSKDELAAAYLRDYDAEFWARFDAACAAHPGDPRAQILAYLSGLGARAVQSGYRGCGLTNAAVEYPESDHPARAVAVAHKAQLRTRLAAMAREMGAADPDALGDGLLLLLEGAFVSSQLFGQGGPAGRVAQMADKLIEAHLAR